MCQLKMWIKSVCVLFLLSAAFGEKFRFNNYTVYKILPKNEDQIKLLQQLQTDEVDYDFWSDPAPSTEYVSVMVKPEKKNNLETFLSVNDINYEISISNVQDAIDKEPIKTYDNNNSTNMTWDAYYSLDDIETWMFDMAASYPEVATPVIAGLSYEGREIRGLKIAHGEGKRVIFIEAGIHSREWIVMSFACYLINELLTSNDNRTMEAAKDYEWYIFPTLNPDGYVWSITDFRMWRKNRRPFGDHFGVDLNRNWDNNFLFVGASTNPASDTFAGPAPFSEPETESVSNFIKTVADRMDIYISFHNFGQILLLPFGNTTAPLANYNEAMRVGRNVIQALSRRFGTEYRMGNIAEAIYHASGSSIDWVKEEFNVRLAYGYELRDIGQYGFFLPADQILDTHLETMDSVLEMIDQSRILDNGARDVSASVGMILLLTFVLRLCQ